MITDYKDSSYQTCTECGAILAIGTIHTHENLIKFMDKLENVLRQKLPESKR